MRLRLTLDRIVLVDVTFLEPVDDDPEPVDFPAPAFGFAPEPLDSLTE